MTAELTPVVDDPDTGGYWQAARGGALAIQLCSKCHQPIHLPRPQCPRCGSTDTSWREVEPAATVYSWAVVRHGVHPTFPVPYTLVLVELRQYPQVRLLTALILELVFFDQAIRIGRAEYLPHARGTGHGVRGADADRGGFDGISYWARTGLAIAAMPMDYDYPISLPGPAVGDIQAGLNLAGGIAAALFHRERTGKGSVVDASLLAAGLWAMQPTIAGSYVIDHDHLPKTDRRRPGNPLANVYRTADGRFVFLAMLEADRYWPGFCEAVGRPEWVADPSLATAEVRLANVEKTVQLLDELFAEHPLTHWTSARPSKMVSGVSCNHRARL